MFLEKKDIIRADGEDSEFRSIFISDIHLGIKFSKSKELLDFFKYTKSENLFLVGDIIDGWAIERKVYWSQSQSDVIQKILKKARKGTNVYYIAGNHDEFLRDFLPLKLGNSIKILDEFEYVSLKNQRFLVIHGDFFDSITVNKKWLALLGDRAYVLLLAINSWLNAIRRKFNIESNWSLAKYLNDNVKAKMHYIEDFEKVLTNHARRDDYYGVICGHIHNAEMRMIDDIMYINTGDWVESCTAVVDTYEGELKLVRWE